MKSGDNFLNNLLNALLPNRAAPVLARVMKAHEGAGKNKYSVDVKVLKAGTLEETDQEIAEVPISPIWATKKKRGIYAMPTEDQIVIVEFIGWNVAYPYVSGIWADEYEADDFGKDKFVITDGNGMVIIIDATENSITVDNGKGCTAKLEDGKKITLDNGKDTIKMINGDIDIICPKPIGINGTGNNLNERSLTPYWTAENDAFKALNTIVANPKLMVQAKILDAMSGGLESVIELVTGLIELTKAEMKADSDAKTSSKLIIK